MLQLDVVAASIVGDAVGESIRLGTMCIRKLRKPALDGDKTGL